MLAALAVMGDTALSPEQLAALTTVADPRPILAELARRGFLRTDEEDRYAVPAGLRERLRDAWNLVDTGDRVLRQLISIAEDGRLTLSDLDAVLGVSQWASEVGRFQELLRLVKAVRTTVDVVRRVEAWITIVQRALQAARALGDLDAEAWAERELAACARIQGDEPRARAHRSVSRLCGGRLRDDAARRCGAGAGLLRRRLRRQQPAWGFSSASPSSTRRRRISVRRPSRRRRRRSGFDHGRPRSQEPPSPCPEPPPRSPARPSSSREP